MKRIKVLIGKRRVMVIATLAILVLAAAALAASSASFTATSANPANTFTAGSLSMSGAGITFDTGVMMPGMSRVGHATVKNEGTGVADFYLKVTTITDQHLGTGIADLSDTLRLVVIDDANPGTPVFTGKLSDFTDQELAGNFVAGTSKAYTFTMTFPDSDKDLGTSGSDNIYQGTQSDVTFDWVAVSK
jgi:hypothetical protein